MSQALTNLGTRFPTQAATRLSSRDILTDVEGKKRLLLDGLYGSERLQKASSDRIVLNPDTAELELLMGEMFKKKLLAKDRLLRDLDLTIRDLQAVDLEVQELTVRREQVGNDNVTLRRELENLKTLYSKTKQASQTETESLHSQLKSMQAANNRREVEHRTLVDRLLSDQKSAARLLADELRDKDEYLTEKIRSLGLDKDRLDQEIGNLKQKSAAFMASFGSELKRRHEQARLEESARADWTNRLIEGRLLSVSSGNDMNKRRSNEELRSFAQSEAEMVSRITQLQEELARKRTVEHSLREAVKLVAAGNDRLVDEDIAADSLINKLKDQAREAADGVRKRRDGMAQDGLTVDDAVAREQDEIEMARRSEETRLVELETTLRKVRLEVERIDAKREYFVDVANRKVATAIADTLGKYPVRTDV